MKNRGQWLIGIVLLGLGIRLVVLLFYLAAHQGRVETWEYEAIARHFMEGKGYTLGEGPTASHAFGSPVFPFLIFLSHGLGGKDNFIPYLLFQFCLFPAILWLTDRLCRRICGGETALWACAGVALEPGLILFGSYRVHEMTWVVFLTLAGLELFASLRERPRWTAVVGMGALLGVSFLTRPTALVWIPVLGLWALLERSKPKVPGSAAVVLAVAALMVFPWAARHHRLFGDWNLLSHNWEILWRGNNAAATGSNLTADGKAFLDAAEPRFRQEVLSSSEHEQRRLFREKSLGYLKADPVGFAVRSAKKFWYFWWFPPTYGMTYTAFPELWRRSYQVLYGGILILASFGCWRAFQTQGAEARRMIVYLGVLAFSLASLHAVVYVEGRHKLVLMPVLLIFSAFGALGWRRGGAFR